MDSLIYYVLVSLCVGGLTYTFGKFAFKLKSNPQIEFNRTYLLTMLLSMVATVALTPIFFVPGLHVLTDAFTANGTVFAVALGFCVGFTANVLVNWPVTYLVNKVATYEAKLKASAATATPLPGTLVTAAAPAKSPINVHRLLEAIVIVILIGALIGASVFAVVTYQASITGTGSITGVGVTIYSDAQGQVNLNAINWGNVAPGASISTAIYVKSTSNTPITLYQATANWSPPSISSALTLTWDYNNATLQPGNIVKINLTLAASTAAPAGTNFSFNMIITATG
ncbi:MAG: hypothetical protein ABSB71_13355 [Candidatus Bathyarchaeia archaeon]|jgi:hypothetical protein